MSSQIAREYPKDLNAEAAVLSAMMIDDRALSQALEILLPEHFQLDPHKKIFRVLKDLFESNTPPDLITISHRLEQRQELENVGGNQYLSELSDVVISGANVEYHARIVLDKALLRMLIESSNKIVRMAYDADKPSDEIVDEAEQMIFQIAERSNLRTFVRIRDLIPDTLDMIQEVAETKKPIVGVPSGFSSLDQYTGGFRPGQLIVLAARPGMGKSSFALNIATNAAYTHNMTIALFTLEMEAQEIIMRIFSSYAEVRMDDMFKGYGLTQDKIRSIAQVANAFTDLPVFIDDSPSNSALDIRAKARRLKAEQKNLDLVIIDYLQLMSSRKKRMENRQQEIADMSRSLKELAKELKVPVVALSQLNRSLESRDDKRPILSDLRESGAIEQDADLVMFIYRDDYYNKESEDKGKAEVIIGKNRHGPTKSVKLRFKAEFTTFQSLEDEPGF